MTMIRVILEAEHQEALSSGNGMCLDRHIQIARQTYGKPRMKMWRPSITTSIGSRIVTRCLLASIWYFSIPV